MVSIRGAVHRIPPPGSRRCVLGESGVEVGEALPGLGQGLGVAKRAVELGLGGGDVVVRASMSAKALA